MIKYFSKLTTVELEKFEEFINSPYFNKSKRIINLFSHLKSLYPEIKKEDINKEALYRIIYGKDAYNDSKARKLLSDFNEVFDRFLLQIERDKDEYSNDVALLISFNNRGMRKKYETSYKKFKAKMDAKFLRDIKRSNAKEMDANYKIDNILRRRVY